MAHDSKCSELAGAFITLHHNRTMIIGVKWCVCLLPYPVKIKSLQLLLLKWAETTQIDKLTYQIKEYQIGQDDLKGYTRLVSLNFEQPIVTVDIHEHIVP